MFTLWFRRDGIGDVAAWRPKAATLETFIPTGDAQDMTSNRMLMIFILICGQYILVCIDVPSPRIYQTITVTALTPWCVAAWLLWSHSHRNGFSFVCARAYIKLANDDRRTERPMELAHRANLTWWHGQDMDDHAKLFFCFLYFPFGIYGVRVYLPNGIPFHVIRLRNLLWPITVDQ